jgi:adenine-specific DNA methylase
MRRIIRRTLSTAESTTETRSATSNTFHNDTEKRNPYQLKSRRRRPKPTPASVSSPVYNTSSVKDSESNMLGSAHASTTYGMWRIKSKTQAIATDNTYSTDITKPKLTQFFQTP